MSTQLSGVWQIFHLCMAFATIIVLSEALFDKASSYSFYQTACMNSLRIALYLDYSHPSPLIPPTHPYLHNPHPTFYFLLLFK